LPCPPPGDLPDPGIKPASFMSPSLASGFFTTSTTWEAPWYLYRSFYLFWVPLGQWDLNDIKSMARKFKHFSTGISQNNKWL